MTDSHNTEEDIKFSKNKMKDILNFEEANEAIPNIPIVNKFPNYDTSEDDLV